MSGMFNSIRIPKKREVRKRKVQKQVSHIAGIMMELNDNKAGMKGLDKVSCQMFTNCHG